MSKAEAMQKLYTEYEPSPSGHPGRGAFACLERQLRRVS